MNELTRCEYCGRGAYRSRDNLSCASCGAPLPVSRPAVFYDPKMINAEDLRFGPGQNIPIQIAYNHADQSIWQLLIQGAGEAGRAFTTPLIKL